MYSTERREANPDNYDPTDRTNDPNYQRALAAGLAIAGLTLEQVDALPVLASEAPKPSLAWVVAHNMGILAAYNSEVPLVA